MKTCNAYAVFKAAGSVATGDIKILQIKLKSPYVLSSHLYFHYIIALEYPDPIVFEGSTLRMDCIRSNGKTDIFDRRDTVFVGNLPFEVITVNTCIK